MPPEQIRGKALPASDLYSLGVTCIHLLTGISPFDLFDVSSDRWVWQDYLLNASGVGERLSKILDKLLQNALSKRYKSAAEVLQVINLAAKPISSGTVRPKPVNSLISQKGVDYYQLRDLLAAKKWQLADQETWAVMCRAISKPIGSYLFNSDIQKLPDEDLQIIDQLWLKYSQGRFGFSIQQQIFASFDGDYGKFCAAIGWNLNNSSSVSHKFSFSSSAPKGHLPSHIWAGGTQWWRHINTLAAKLATCYHELTAIFIDLNHRPK